MSENIEKKLSIPEDILQLAFAVFGNADKAKLWLCTPIRALAGDTPLERLNDDDGRDEVRVILCKIENGEFS